MKLTASIKFISKHHIRARNQKTKYLQYQVHMCKLAFRQRLLHLHTPHLRNSHLLPRLRTLPIRAPSPRPINRDPTLRVILILTDTLTSLHTGPHIIVTTRPPQGQHRHRCRTGRTGTRALLRVHRRRSSWVLPWLRALPGHARRIPGSVDLCPTLRVSWVFADALAASCADLAGSEAPLPSLVDWAVAALEAAARSTDEAGMMTEDAGRMTDGMVVWSGGT